MKNNIEDLEKEITKIFSKNTNYQRIFDMCDDLISRSMTFKRNSKFITNFDGKKRPLYEEAIQVSGRADMYIDEASSPCCLDNYLGLYSDSLQNCSEFWKVFRSLENAPEWKMFEILSSSD